MNIILTLPQEDVQFEQDGLQFRFTVTDQILINKDNEYKFDVTANTIQVIGKAFLNERILKLESDHFQKSEFTLKLWHYWLARMVTTATEKLK